MHHLLLNRLTFVWIGLIAATLLSWELGHGLGFTDPRHAGVGIIVVSFIKVRFVLLEFMEVRHTPPAMRLVGEAWVVGVCAALSWLFWRATGVAAGGVIS